MSYSSIIYPKASQLIRHTESVVDVHSKATPFRHFGIKPGMCRVSKSFEVTKGASILQRLISV